MNPGCFSEPRPPPGAGAARLGKLAPRRLGTPGPNFLPRRPQRPRRRRDSPEGVWGSPPREGCLSRILGVARGRRSQPPSARSLPRRASPQCRVCRGPSHSTRGDEDAVPGVEGQWDPIPFQSGPRMRGLTWGRRDVPWSPGLQPRQRRGVQGVEEKLLPDGALQLWGGTRFIF